MPKSFERFCGAKGRAALPKTEAQRKAAKKEKVPQTIDLRYFLASWKGLEPPACRLGGDRSIQLSYQDVYEIVCHRRWKGIRLGGERSILLSYGDIFAPVTLPL